MVTNELLECLFSEIKNVPPNNTDNKYLQLLLTLSTCGMHLTANREEFSITYFFVKLKLELWCHLNLFYLSYLL